jgi:hypothetical protein
MATETPGGVALTDVEQRLVDHVTRGELLDLTVDEPVNEAAMRSWDDSRTIRATVLRDILRGRLAKDPDPHGLRLRGARIAGQLDLENLIIGVGVQLDDCLLGKGVVARDAKLPLLILCGCRLEHPSEPPLDADRLTAAALYLDRAMITANCVNGAVRLAGAQLGRLECDGATIRNDSGPALDADGLRADQGVFLRGGFEALVAGEGGAARMVGVVPSGRFEAVGASELGAVRMAGAHLGRLDCNRATIRNESGPALLADGLRTDQGVFLRGGFEAVGAGELGAVRMGGAHLGNQLDCTDAKIRNGSGPALLADGLRTDQGVFLRGGFEAVGTAEVGAVRLTGAHLGRLECDGATLRNGSGPALHADSLRVDQDVFLRGGFEADGAGELGAVRMGGAHLGNQLDCTNAKIRNGSGPALLADGLQVDQGAFLSGRFEAVGTGEVGAVRLTGAHLLRLEGDGATLRNESGPALAADSLQVEQGVYLRGGSRQSARAKPARSAWSAPTSAGWSATVPRCATSPVPPWPPTACRSTRMSICAAGSRQSVGAAA